MANKASLVDQIKQIQRSDPEAKQQWWDYCDTNLGGIKDPNRHDVSVLESFLSEYGTGSLGPSNPSAKPQKRRPASTSMEGYGYGHSGYNAWTGCGGCGYAAYPSQWGMGGGAGGGDTMASMVKTGQRKSQHWKTAWQAYCGLYGNGFNDPARYDEAFLVGFIDYVGQLAAGDLGNAPPPAGGSDPTGPGGQKRSLSGSMAQPPPSKRVAGGGYAGSGGNDFEKSELVERIKSLQRTDSEAKTAWWNFCDEFQGGIKDPNRHEVATLQKFLAGYD